MRFASMLLACAVIGTATSYDATLYQLQIRAIYRAGQTTRTAPFRSALPLSNTFSATNPNPE